MIDYLNEKETEGGVKEKIFSVSEYLDYLNLNLKKDRVKIIGEVTSLQEYPERSYMYFSIKDKKDSSTVKCFMWKRDYKLSSVLIEDGLEVVIGAYANVYKPSGSMTLQVSSIELVGEGAIKIAYEKLKKQLESEGLFDEARKKEIPLFPKRIGVLTSKSGAVINDFLTNLGKYGFEINFVDIKVEGLDAVKDILNGLRVLYREKLDCLVIMRGGGSLESFQAFNNENVVRAVSKFNCPVITGLGHDKDLPLLSFISDKNVSTPTAVANLLNKGFEMAKSEVSLYQEKIVYSFSEILNEKNYFLEQSKSILLNSFDKLVSGLDSFYKSLQNFQNIIFIKIEENKKELDSIAKSIVLNFNHIFESSVSVFDSLSKRLLASDPKKALNLGFSIVRMKGKIIKSVKDVNSGQEVLINLCDGDINAKII